MSLLIACSDGLAAEPTATGSITGAVDKAGSVSAIRAVHRRSGKSYSAQFDAQSGQFSIDALPLGASYDAIIEYAGSRLEGVNLEVPRSDYVEEQPLAPEDVEVIETKVRRMSAFEHVIDILAVRGNIQHAAVLMNKLRPHPFFGSKPGEVIWRAELWHFERPEETWVKVQDELFIVLYRQRLDQSEYDKKSLAFSPALGGLKLTAEESRVDLGRIELPPAEPGIRLLDPTENRN